MRNIIIVFFLLIFANLNAQELSFHKVDSTVKSLFIDEKWDELSIYGTNAISENFDYLNIRLYVGIAYFMQEKFIFSVKHLKKALVFNSYNTSAKYYLFLSYLEIGNDFMASEVFKELPDSVKQNINYKPNKSISFLYPEMGLKISNKNDIAENLKYVGFYITEKPKSNLLLMQSYIGLKQNLAWGHYSQNQFGINGYVYLGKGYELSIGADYSIYNAEYNYNNISQDNSLENFFIQGIRYISDTFVKTNRNFNGTLKQDLINLNLSIEKDFNFFNIEVGNAVFFENINSNFTDKYDVDSIFKRIRNNLVVYQFDTSYTYFNDIEKSNIIHFLPRITADFRLGNNLTLNLESFHYYNKDFSKIVFVPSLTIRFNKNTFIKTYYMSKTYFPSLLNSNHVLNTSYNTYDYRFSSTFNTKIDDKIFIFITYQNESIYDIISFEEYNLNSLILGLKIII